MKKLILACTRTKRLALLLAALAFSGPSAWAVDLNLSTNPMDVQQGVDPNIIFTMDDSGSMAWSYLPDGIRNDRNTDRGKSSEYNLIYFDPTITYKPGVDENGVSLGDATFTAAWDNGYQQGSTCTPNLATSFRPSWRYGNNCDGSTGGEEFAGPAEAAYYFQYNAVCGNPNSDACYAKVVVSAAQQQNFANWYSYYRKRHMLAKTASTLAFSKVSSKVRLAYQCLNNSSGAYKCNTVSLMQEFSGTARTNFFTWLSNVPFSGGTPLLRAVQNAGNEFSKPSGDVTNPYRSVPGGTAAGDDVEYACRQSFHIAFTDGVWNTYQPSIGNVDNSTITLPGFNAGAGDKGTDFGVNSYTPMAPFKDSNSNFLADIAMLYWATDLRPDLDNVVSQYIPEDSGVNATTFWDPANDPAHWQHMVNFTVSMGLAGTLDPQADKDAIYAGSKTWNNNHVDDLWHAAINGRGEYFTADNPTNLVDRFTKVLNAISERQGSSTAPATSFPLFAAGSIVFQPRFSSSDWTGELIAIDVTKLGNGRNFAADIDVNKVWSAATELNTVTRADRDIMSYDPDLSPATSRGIKFDWASMKNGGILQTLLNRDKNDVADTLGQDRANFIAGDRSNERVNGGSFRNREKTILGDLVNSTPVFVGSPFREFRDDMETGEAYSKFKDDKCDRPRRIYVGGNDGMLHGFDAGTLNCTDLTTSAGTGKEVMAYVPSPVYRNLNQLPDPIYKDQHRFFVDGSPTEADVFYGGKWHTIITGGLNAGGQGIYALDITTGIFNESLPNNTVLWEFTDLDDKDLGYTYSQPRVVRLNTGSWGVTFGNGYNNTEDDSAVGGQFSSSGNAVLYVVNAETGALIKKLDTGVGLSDAASNNRPNGLATVEPIDINDDRIVDFIYGGDLYGNLWKFDVRSNNTNLWKVEKLFVAAIKSGGTTTYQPITAPPKAIRNPNGVGAIIVFGTGKHLEVSDLSDPSVQSMYGVWDRFETNTTQVKRDNLFEQRILGTESNQFTQTEARVTSKGKFDYFAGSGLPGAGSKTYMGWYMDLFDPDDAIQPYKGEKMVKNMAIRGNRVIFVTDVPSEDPCEAGGSSWLMEIDARFGGRLPESPFDFDFDGQFAVEDLVDSNFNGEGQDVVGSGIRHKAPGGKFSAPTIIRDLQAGTGREKKLVSNSDGSLSMMDEQDNDNELGRRSWRQLLAP